MRKLTYTFLTFFAMTSLSYANVHKWQNKEFQSYSDKTQVSFVLVNRYNKPADYYLRIDNKSFPDKISLGPNQKIELDISVNTPPGKTTDKLVCTRMVSDSPNSYEVCSTLHFKRF